jgi:hypothetical protein
LFFFFFFWRLKPVSQARIDAISNRIDWKLERPVYMIL